MFFFRADASSEIGMGHIMRCLSIADALSPYTQVLFILADNTAQSIIEHRGYKTFILGSDYRDMENELPLWPPGLPDCVIIDSYYVTVNYLSSIKRRAKVVYIDDLAAFPYPVDILVNYNAYGLLLDYQDLYSGCAPKLLLGPQFAPLRAMFCSIDRRIQPDRVRDILVSTGGADPLHLALDFAKLKQEKYIFHLLLGPLNGDKAEIKTIAAQNNSIVLHENITDMRSLISRCDLAVSAAGSMLYELCACGVPVVTFISADNQIIGAEAFQRLGMAINSGDLRELDCPAHLLLNQVDLLAHDFQQRIQMGAKMQEMIDGYGATRIVKAILQG